MKKRFKKIFLFLIFALFFTSRNVFAESVSFTSVGGNVFTVGDESSFCVLESKLDENGNYVGYVPSSCLATITGHISTNNVTQKVDESFNYENAKRTYVSIIPDESVSEINNSLKEKLTPIYNQNNEKNHFYVIENANVKVTHADPKYKHSDFVKYMDGSSATLSISSDESAPSSFLYIPYSLDADISTIINSFEVWFDDNGEFHSNYSDSTFGPSDRVYLDPGFENFRFSSEPLKNVTYLIDVLYEDIYFFGFTDTDKYFANLFSFAGYDLDFVKTDESEDEVKEEYVNVPNTFEGLSLTTIIIGGIVSVVGGAIIINTLNKKSYSK